MSEFNPFRKIAWRHAARRFDSFQTQAELIAIRRRNADQVPVTIRYLFLNDRTALFLSKECQVPEEVHFRKPLLSLKLLVPILCRQPRTVFVHTGKSCHAS